MLDKNKIKIIGFDLDQTLYPKSPEIDESIQSYIYKKISEHKDCCIKEAKKLFKGLYKDGRGLSGRKTLIKLEIPNAENIVQEALENADIDSFLKPDEEVINLLKTLKKSFVLDIITGSNKKIAEKKIKKLNIQDLFDHVITSETASKSSSEAYDHWMNIHTRYTPEEFLYIGDRVSTDHDVPNKMGIQTVLVNIKKEQDGIGCPQLKSLVDIKKFLL